MSVDTKLWHVTYNGPGVSSLNEGTVVGTGIKIGALSRWPQTDAFPAILLLARVEKKTRRIR